MNIAVSNYIETADKCVQWAEDHESRTVVFANVHVVMEAYDDENFRRLLNSADLVNPDGMPLVWALRAIGMGEATRVYGPDATEYLLGRARDAKLRVGFYGGSPSTLKTLIEEVHRRYKDIEIAYTMSPPFRPLSAEEDARIVSEIVESGTQLLFVGLGCPKQEEWIMDHCRRVPAVMLAVGAAFDFLANTKPQAPRWMMNHGLEWIFRLATEPGRLAGRYLKHNPRFVALFFCQWIKFAALRNSVPEEIGRAMHEEMRDQDSTEKVM